MKALISSALSFPTAHRTTFRTHHLPPVGLTLLVTRFVIFLRPPSSHQRSRKKFLFRLLTSFFFVFNGLKSFPSKNQVSVMWVWICISVFRLLKCKIMLGFEGGNFVGKPSAKLTVLNFHEGVNTLTHVSLKSVRLLYVGRVYNFRKLWVCFEKFSTE